MPGLKIKILLFLILFTSLFFLINGKIHILGKKFLYEEKIQEDGKKRTYSDLYRICRVDYFKEEFPYTDEPESTCDPDSCDIFVFGDSFFNVVIDTENVPAAVQRLTGKETYNASLYKGLGIGSPLGFLKKYKIKARDRRILILESAERYSFNAGLKSYLNEKENYDFFYYTLQIPKIFLFSDVEYWFTNSVFSEKLVSLKSTFYFNRFGLISPDIPAYSASPRFLFYFEEVNFNKVVKQEKDISKISDNVNKLAEILDKQYNISLIYLIIPNKYTMYGKYAGNDFIYDNYIPKIYGGLDENTNSINLFRIYTDRIKKDSSELLYFHSDTHYNLIGRSIAIEEIIKKINDIYSSNLIKNLNEK